jgi:endonuclease/exonuclease/phosphatase family metal-dependent hydrolase
MSKGHSRNRSFLRHLLLVINILAALCLLMSYAAAFVSPARYWIFAFFGISYPVILAVNLAFIVLWLVTWKKLIFISLVIVLAGFHYILSVTPIRLPVSRQTPPPDAFRIMTFNVHSLYGKTNRNYDPKTPSRVMEFIASERPDIVCIQEFFATGQESDKILKTFMERVYASHYFYRNYISFPDSRKINALAIFSRFPITGTGSVQFRGKSEMAIYTDMLIGRDTVRIFNLHLESIRFGNEDYSFYSHLTEPSSQNMKLTEGSLKIFGKLKKAFILRAEQVDILSREIARSHYPAIVCGDFNDTPFSYTYQQLSKGLRDTYREAGHGLFGSTYAGSFPAFRIDYILTDGSFEAYQYQKYNTDLSDHNPVSVFLKKVK